MSTEEFCGRRCLQCHKSVAVFTALFCALMLSFSISAYATTFTVTSLEDDGTTGTLRYLIENGASDGDTINVPVGIYLLDKHKGAIDIDKNLTIQGANRDTTIIDGNGERSDERIFEIDNFDKGVSVLIASLTIKNGMAHHDGGAIKIRNHGSLQLYDTTVSYNESRESGGAIAIEDDGSLIVGGKSLITRNKARHDGGGIYNRDGSVVIADGSVVSYNEAGSCGENDDFITKHEGDKEEDGCRKCGYGGGGGIYTEDGGTEILESEVSHNKTGQKAGDGGGIQNNYSALFMRNCTVAENWAVSGEGGGLDNHYTTLINNCLFYKNQAEDNHDLDDYDFVDSHTQKSRHRINPCGGAIYTDEQLTIVNSFVTLNFSEENGGGICNDDSLTVVKTTINNNVAGFDEACEKEKCHEYDDGAGGGIYSDSELNVGLSLIDDNSANKGPGGGIYIDGSGIIDKSTISNNTAVQNDGGGIYSEGDPVVITESTIADNQALGSHPCPEGDYLALKLSQYGQDVDSRGGGIWVDEPMDISNSTIVGNEADGDGGGIYNEADLQLNNDTIASNTSDANQGGETGGDGGGIANFNDVAFVNTIIGNNVDASPGAEAPDCFSEFTLAGNSMNSGGANLIMNPLNCEVTGDAANVVNVDPLLDPLLLQDNGGPTQTVALVNGSPAIDTGDDKSCLPTDQRGVLRPVGPHCDLGAYEAGGNLCGNGLVDLAEQCDNGSSNGTASNPCSSACQLIFCGNGVLDASEECDLGNGNSNGGACEENCTLPVCGNKILDTGEQCDDGNETSGDGCNSSCKLESCGNGILEPGEQCDLGTSNQNGGNCEADCSLPACGNGVLDAGEQCDDGSN
ncbi:MAG: hypothetical protein ACD_73C00005G0001, partial [uncultured bacterium]